ncbi:hypothetical protein [Haloferula sp. BvORR071]|uniref:hypothetical protein n=1 Tax=Haloferula sp. BvORR071 TaxID=1396141 RepID=UPI0005520E0A|nr:hypothetical protein [Haloferula sp. BvORR071]
MKPHINIVHSADRAAFDDDIHKFLRSRPFWRRGARDILAAVGSGQPVEISRAIHRNRTWFVRARCEAIEIPEPVIASLAAIQKWWKNCRGGSGHIVVVSQRAIETRLFPFGPDSDNRVFPDVSWFAEGLKLRGLPSEFVDAAGEPLYLVFGALPMRHYLVGRAPAAIEVAIAREAAHAPSIGSRKLSALARDQELLRKRLRYLSGTKADLKLAGPTRKKTHDPLHAQKIASIVDHLTSNLAEIIRRERHLMFTAKELVDVGRRTGLLGALDRDRTVAARQIGVALGKRHLKSLRMKGCGDAWFLPSITMDDTARERFWDLETEGRVALYLLIRDSVVLGTHFLGFKGPQPFTLDTAFWARLAADHYTVNGLSLDRFLCPEGNIRERSNTGAHSLHVAIEHILMALIGGLGSCASRPLPSDWDNQITGDNVSDDDYLCHVFAHIAEKNIHPILCHTPPYYRDE